MRYNWLTIADYCKEVLRLHSTDSDRKVSSAIYAQAMYSLKKKGNNDKFRRENGLLQINSEYEEVLEEEINLLRDLVIEATSYFPNEYALACYIHKGNYDKIRSLYTYIRDFRFSQDREKRLEYIDIFKKLVKEKRN